MSAYKRRKDIMKLLKSKRIPISGNELSMIFKVTRQVIVQDIAILRAAGNDIIATSQGYMALGPDPLLSKKIAVKHDINATREELMTFIECGCKVIDVIVEHPIYGELHGMLMLQNSQDVDEFMHRVEKSNAALLSLLTEGVHLHTVEALNQDAIARAETLLQKKGILLK